MYTPSGYATEAVIIVSNLNIVRIINSVNGAVLVSRTLDPPFQDADEGCTNSASVGITGTPLIDSGTDTIYFYAKSYANSMPGPQWTLQGNVTYPNYHVR